MDPVHRDQDGTRIRGARSALTDLMSLVGARGVGMALSLVSVVITTRLLAPDVYALVAYVSVTGFLIFTVVSSWTSAAVFRYGREELETEGRMAGTTWARAAMTAPLVLLAIPVAVIAYLLGAFPADFSVGFLVASLVIGFAMVISEHFIYMTEASGRIKRGALAQILQQALAVVGLAFLLITGISDAPEVVIAISIAAAVVIAIWLGAGVWRISVWPPRFDRVLFRRILALSVPLIAVVVSQYVIRSVDLFAIGALLTVADVGVYAVAYQAFNMGFGLATAIPPVFAPLMVSLDVSERPDLIARYHDRVVPQLAFVASVALGLAAPIAPLVVPVAFGDEFAAAASPLVLLLAALWLAVVAHLLAPILLLRERVRLFLWSSVAAAVFNAIAVFLLVSPLGIEGAAIATIGAYLIYACAYIPVVRGLVGSTQKFNWLVAVPLVLGVVPAALAGTGSAIAIGLPAVLISSIALLRATDLLNHADLAVLDQMDVPDSLAGLLRRLAAVAGENTSVPSGAPGPP